MDQTTASTDLTLLWSSQNQSDHFGTSDSVLWCPYSMGYHGECLGLELGVRVGFRVRFRVRIRD